MTPWPERAPQAPPHGREASLRYRCLGFGAYLLIDLFFFPLGVHRIFFYIPCIALSFQHLSIEFMLNQKTHDLIRSGPDHLQSRIAEEPLDRIDIRLPA